MNTELFLGFCVTNLSRIDVSANVREQNGRALLGFCTQLPRYEDEKTATMTFDIAAPTRTSIKRSIVNFDLAMRKTAHG